jgi:protein SCO1/2
MVTAPGDAPGGVESDHVTRSIATVRGQGGAVPARGTMRVLLWGAFAAVVIGVVIAGVLAQLGPRVSDLPGSALPIYGAVPEFRLVERDGRAVTAEDLRGRIWVVNFVFTRCPGMCPGLSGRMAALQRALREARRGDDAARQRTPHDVMLVSISVDPARDTPADLERYAERFGAEPEGWWFLTGPLADVRRLVGDGFHLVLAEAPAPVAPPTEPITHSDRFVLVDRALRIRGYFHGTEEGTVAAVLEGIEQLRREPSA